MKVLIFSRFFPVYHPRKGESTLFVEKIWKGLKTGNPHDGEYTIYSKLPRLMKDGHWQLPHLWRDQMLDKTFYAKYHTIRAGNRWKVGDLFSPRVWSGLPYRSKQIVIAPTIEIKKVWSFEFYGTTIILSDKVLNSLEVSEVAKNDGLSYVDFISWFRTGKPFIGQIICWDEKTQY